MPIAGQQVGFIRQGGCIDNGVSRGQFVAGAHLCREERDLSGEIGDNASRGECNELFSSLRREFTSDPFGQLHLNDGRY
nr:hypothetical protein [uncultured Rhodopila sp.]